MIGKVQHRFSSIDSTNKYAIDLLSKIRPTEGTAIISDFQTLGKGQIDSKWESNYGDNILMSVILYPEFLTVENQYLITCFVSLAVRNVMVHYLQEDTIKVKWPNDTYCNGKKIAGILIHNTLKGKNLKSSVIGIGININQEEFSNNIPNVTSLRLENKLNNDIEEVRNFLFEELNNCYSELKKSMITTRKKYIEKLYGLNVKKEFLTPEGTSFLGTIIGINKQGFLLIENQNEIRKFDIKQVIYS